MGVEAPSTEVIYMGMGRDYGCLLTDGGDVYCWGDNAYGNFGNGTTDPETTPVKIDFGGAFGSETVTQLSVGYGNVCAITDAAALYCWGSNYYGQIGDGFHNIYGGGGTDRLTPYKVSDNGGLAGKTVTQVSTGTDTICALTSEQRVYCWGDNTNSQVGFDVNIDNIIVTPTAVDTGGGSPMDGKDIVQVETNQYMSCALDTAGVAYCWGYNFSGLLGNNGPDGYVYQPVAVDTTGVLAGKTVESISVGQTYACAITTDGLGYCWGNNGHGERGDGTTTTPRVPTAINMSGALSGLTLKSLSTNVYSTCAIASDDNAYCWGANDEGYLAINVPCASGWCSQLSPVAVYTGGLLSGKSIKHISTHYYSTCMVSTDDRIYCSGNNDYYQLSDGTTTPSIQAVGGERISYDVLAGANSYQLEYAPLSAASCEAQTTGFAAVTGATPVAYTAVSGVSSGSSISNEANDPTAALTTTPQALYGTTGTIATVTGYISGDTALWDYSLVDNDMTSGETYCLRMAYSGGTPLENYPHVAAVSVGTTPPGGTGGSGSGGEPDPSTDPDGEPSLADTGVSTLLLLLIGVLAMGVGVFGSARLLRQ